MNKYMCLTLVFFCFQSFLGQSSKKESVVATNNYNHFKEIDESEFEWPDERWKTENGRKSVIWFAILELDKYFRVQNPSYPLDNGVFTGMMSNLLIFQNTRAMIVNSDINHSLINIYHARRTMRVLDEIEFSTEVLSCDNGADACVIVERKKSYWCKVYTQEQQRLNRPARSQNVTNQEYHILKEKVKDPNSPITKVELSYDTRGDLRASDRVSANLSINENVFIRGFHNLDPEGTILWNDDYTTSNDKNFYFNYATSLSEAVEFLLLHEYGHAIGLKENITEAFALNMIVKLRKAKKNNQVVNIDFFDDFGSKFQHDVATMDAVETFSFFHHGKPPTKSLPPGCRRKR